MKISTGDLFFAIIYNLRYNFGWAFLVIGYLIGIIVTLSIYIVMRGA